MKNLIKLIPALVISTTCLGLAAQSTGVLTGTVKDSKGNPLPKASVVLNRVGVNWTKTLDVDENGKFMQVGLEPREHDLEITSPGLFPYKERLRFKVTEPVIRDIVLYTPEEAVAKGLAAPAAQVDPSAEAENAALKAFNDGVTQFNGKAFNEALPNFELAYKQMSESLAKATDDAAKADLEKKFAAVERVYGFTLAEVAKEDETRRAELAKQAVPILKQALVRDPKEQNALIYLVDVLRAMGENAEADKYQLELDKLIGPNPAVAYNKGVEAFNSGKMKEARPFLQKTLDIDPKFAEAYYLLAMCDYSEMNLRGTKLNLQKYLELAPNGKNADTAKAMLADPSLKNVR